MNKTCSVAILATVTVALQVSPASSDFLTKKELRSGLVTACSTYGHVACYTARLVRTPSGYKMRLKGGTLIDCEGDCRDALRRETVDFWDTQRESSGDGK